MSNVNNLPNGIKENVSLAEYTTFKIGGPARYFCIVKNKDEAIKAFEFVRKNSLKYFILGGGSKILVADKGFGGLVIKVQSSKFKVQSFKIFCDSGISLAKLISESVKAGLTGLEWAVGIPGITVGGAIHNNAGAHGKSMADIVKEVEVLDIGNCETRKLNNKDCLFTYRGSIFRETKKYIILSAALRLEKGDGDKSRETMAEFMKIRNEKQPLGEPSAGSIFKNPAVDENLFAKLLKEYPELKDVAKNNVILAGWLIETLGLEGKKIGGAMISPKHANFIVNAGNAKAEDVVILISLIKQKVRTHFGIQLKEEIEYVGF